jgi:hypothetical protein
MSRLQTREVEMKVIITFKTASKDEAFISKRSLEIKRKLRCAEHILQEYIGDLAHVDYKAIQFDIISGNKARKSLTE